MKVRIGRDELLIGLQRVQGVVEKRNTMPILSNILLEAKHEGAEIVATDLEIGMRGLYKATVLEPGGVTLSARKLYEIIKELPAGDVEMTSADNDWTTIQAGKSQFKIVGLPSGDYPALPVIEREGLTPLAGAGFLELIRKTLFAAGDNDARYILNGLLVTLAMTDKKTVLRLVGTDGHRLAVAEQEVGKPGSKDAPKEIKAIIPKKGRPGDTPPPGRRRRRRAVDRVHQESDDLSQERAAPDVTVDGGELPQLSAGPSQGEQQADRRQSQRIGRRAAAGVRPVSRQGQCGEAVLCAGEDDAVFEQSGLRRSDRRVGRPL
ncbi:MAG: hypothetical protein KatS3mg082_0934 [Nitrospiraceae bacterium]|nr:MAG: hypothetical protein KatS3mg082_0934 [Nitrospiraceae bacterium]